MSDSSPRWHLFVLHVFALSGFALAQPLYDWISRQPEFLAAHGLEGAGLVLIVITLSLAVPLLIAFLALIFRLLGHNAARGIQLLVIGLLCGLLVLELLPALPAAVMYGLAATGVIAGGVLYWRWSVFRSGLSMAAVGAVIFPVLFLGTDPVRSLLWSPGDFAAAMIGERPADEATPDVDVVYVMLDELPVATLLDETGQVDSRRFPAFARLSRQATWYPNAATVHYGTVDAVPASLTGMLPDPARAAPYWRFYEDNLFLWAAKHYGESVHALESMTGLCPASICVAPEFAPTDAGARIVLLLDIAILYGWRILPEATATRWLPSIEETWNEFAADELAGFRLGFDRVEAWHWFVDGLDAGFNFHHSVLPHMPHAYLPDGSQYRRNLDTLGYSRTGGIADLNVLELQRHVAQARFTDRLLGELLDRLEASGRWDNTLLVVTADHGRSFRRDSHWRSLDQDNLGDVLAIPLFIKYPGQQGGVVDERPASLIDIPVTIADVTDRDLYWEHDGISLATGTDKGLRETLPVSCKGDWACMPEVAEKTGDDKIFWLPVEELVRRVEAMRAGIHQRLEYVEPLDFDVLASPFTSMLGQPVTNYNQYRSMPEAVAFVGARPAPWMPEDPLQLPALIGLRFERDEPEAGDTLMLAVNGQLAAVGEVVLLEDGTRFSAFFYTGALLRHGSNELAVYEVWQEKGRPRLRQLQAVE